MLVTKDNIADLLPQRYPMVMIDSLLSCDDKQAVTQLSIEEDNIFLRENAFIVPGLMENMAQTAAARTGFLLRNQAGTANKKPPVGVIGSIKNFRLYFQPALHEKLTTTINVEPEVLQALVVKGKVEVGGRLAAEADLQIFLTEDQSEQA